MAKRVIVWFAMLALGSRGGAVPADDLASLRADRAAIERVYHKHRLGEKPPFAFLLVGPQEVLLGQGVRQSLSRSAGLWRDFLA